MNFLIINFFGVGDVLLTTPMIQVLKEAYPKSKIGFLCNKKAKPLLEANLDIDNIYVYEREKFKAICRHPKVRYVKEIVNLLKSIKKDKYNVVFDLSLERWYSFLLMLIGIRTRIGYNYKNKGTFLSIKIAIDGYRDSHVAEYYLKLLKYLGITVKVGLIKLHIPEDNKNKAENILKDKGIEDNKLLIGIAPAGGVSCGSNVGYEYWPARYFAEIIDSLVKELNARIILFGLDDEKKICDGVISYLDNIENVYNLAGGIDLLTFAALLEKCNLLICNDGYPLHVGVGCGIKTISIFGPVDEKVYGPYPANNDNVVISKSLPCRPCYHRFKMPKCNNDNRCINEIKPKEVLTVVKNVVSV